MNEMSATATKRAIVALEIHKILDERSAVVSEEGRFDVALRVCIAVVPIASYISATRGDFHSVFRENRTHAFYL